MKKYRLDVVSQTLVITAEFAKKMNDPESEEYKLVVKVKSDFPNLKITQRTHRTPTSYTNKNGERTTCNQFKNLTYERMEGFISLLPQKEEYMKQFSFLLASAKIRHCGYASVRRWFLAQFPYYNSNPIFYLHNQIEIVPAEEYVEELAMTA